MKTKRILFYIILVCIGVFLWLVIQHKETKFGISETVKIALRDAGNQLLLAEKDSTSLILPVKKIHRNVFELSFQSQLTFEPNTLVTVVDSSFKKAKLPTDYRVEVIQCTDGEVGYSYQMTAIEETTIIPCSGRLLPKNCYTIEVAFTEISMATNTTAIAIGAFFMIVFIVMEGFYFRKKSDTITDKTPKVTEDYATLGSFLFYPDQNKLIKEATEIQLSKKECELLKIFTANPNQIVTRDELTKKVWEDNGVIVGRSLDTYISKIRKKLKDDQNIKLTNIHGVGYKLEVLDY